MVVMSSEGQPALGALQRALAPLFLDSRSQEPPTRKLQGLVCDFATEPGEACELNLSHLPMS